MKITDKSYNERTCFKNLELADIFRFNGLLFMKTANAIAMTSMDNATFDDDKEVQYVPSELILHERGWNENSISHPISNPYDDSQWDGE